MTAADATPTNATVIEPLSADRWPDLCTLFGRGGANSGCWCMWWRLRAADWTAGAGAAAREPGGNREALENVVRSGAPVGLLAYRDGTPVGWCAVAPREAYPRIIRSTTIAPLDPHEPGVWSVSCFFINRRHRGTGLAHALLAAAVAWAKKQGAITIEGYPVETRDVRGVSGDYFTGTPSLYAAAGFTREERPNPGKRFVMRRPA